MRRTFGYMLSALFMLQCTVHAALADMKFDEELNHLRGLLETGGIAMKVILVLSGVGVFLVLYFLLTLRGSVIYPRRFLREAEDAAEEGDAEALEAICQTNGSPAAKIIYAAAEHVVTNSNAEYMIVRDAIEDEGARQAALMWQRIQYLMDIAVVAPMVGLLGTVIGMLDSFAGMEAELGAVRPTTLAQGVSKALITTAGGLIVGIAATILYALFRGRVNKLIARLEQACNRILRQFISARERGNR